ncbi:MAG: NUDIX hydrolase [Patescibacteria group bacterium]
MESDEQSRSAARRELLEETGYDAEFFDLLVSHRVVSIDSYMHFWIARNLYKVSEPMLDSGGERITTFEVSWDEFCELLFSGKLKQIELEYMFLKHYRLDPTLAVLKKQILG